MLSYTSIPLWVGGIKKGEKIFSKKHFFSVGKIWLLNREYSRHDSFTISEDYSSSHQVNPQRTALESLDIKIPWIFIIMLVNARASGCDYSRLLHLSLWKGFFKPLFLCEPKKKVTSKNLCICIIFLGGFLKYEKNANWVNGKV